MFISFQPWSIFDSNYDSFTLGSVQNQSHIKSFSYLILLISCISSNNRKQPYAINEIDGNEFRYILLNVSNQKV